MIKALSLPKIAQQIIAEQLTLGDTAIDATLGNGFDTLFLAECVGDQGHVFGFDIQLSALEQTQHHLHAQQLLHRVTLFQQSHANISSCLPVKYQGKVAAIMFNLGYLPGGDKTIITQTQSTLSALSIACDWLSINGIITVLAYPGHIGGDQEMDAIVHFLANLAKNPDFIIDTIDYQQSNSHAPRLFVIRKQICYYDEFFISANESPCQNFQMLLSSKKPMSILLAMSPAVLYFLLMAPVKRSVLC